MATTRKFYTRAKAESVVKAVDTLLRDTDQDPTLSLLDRAKFIDIKMTARELAERLRAKEARNARS